MKNNLIITNIFGGGATEFLDEKLKSEYQNNIILQYNFITKKFIVNQTNTFDTFTQAFSAINNSPACVIDNIIINSLISFPNLENIFKTLKQHNKKITYLLHDFYCVCQSINLLENFNKYCELKMEDTKCENCLCINKKNIGHFIIPSIKQSVWKRVWIDFLNDINEIICFSSSSKDILSQAYPTLQTCIKVQPHKVVHINTIIKNTFDNTSTLNIAIPGNLTIPKGNLIINELCKISCNKNIKFHILGETIQPKLENLNIVLHGKYNKNNLCEIFKKLNIHAGIIPSICPETFCYTSKEMELMDIPIFAFAIGAPGERLKKYNKGIVIKEFTAEALLNSICKKFNI